MPYVRRTFPHPVFASPAPSRALASAWDAAVSATATVAALLVPLALLPESVGAERLRAFETAFTLVFALDAAVRAWRLRGARRRRRDRAALALDVLAALPLVLLGAPRPWILLRTLKLVRVSAVVQGVARLHAGWAPRLRLATFLYGLGLVVHAVACGFVGLGGAEAYVDALYWSVTTVTTVGYGDVTPSTAVQKLYAVGVMLLGAGVYAFLIGNIASLLNNLHPLRTAHAERQERVAAFMHYRALPRPLRERVQAYFDYAYEQNLVADEDAALADLPPALREEVALHLRRDLVRNVPLFRDADDAFVRDVALQMHSFVCLPGDDVVRAGDRGHEMYFIARGVLEAIAPDGRVYGTLRAGDFFGEIAIVDESSALRTATVRAVTPCDLYALSDAMFGRIAEDYPAVAARVREEASRRRDADEAR